MRTGEIEKTVQVFTNDPAHKIIKIILKANVIDE